MNDREDDRGCLSVIAPAATILLAGLFMASAAEAEVTRFSIDLSLVESPHDCSQQYLALSSAIAWSCRDAGPAGRASAARICSQHWRTRGDSSGGVLPGVTVTIVNNGTNATTVVVTGDGGTFMTLFLISGNYRVTVELTGFRTTVREKVDVRVGDRLQVDFTLEPANIATEITVVASAPLMDSGTATMGQVIDSKLIGEMPLGDGTVYGLARLVPGASFERSYALQRPMDNDNLRGLTISGTINSEFTIDGSSNIVSGARVGIQPPSDSISEFKVETAVYDAQIGHTGAGNVNLALKSGTNQFHGAASFYNRDDTRSAVLYASERLGTGVTPRDYNRFSAMVSGPIFKNRTFFMGSYEKLQDNTIETVTNSVPRMRCAAATSPSCSRLACRFRPQHRAPRQRRGDARCVSRQHHPGQSHQPDCR